MQYRIDSCGFSNLTFIIQYHYMQVIIFKFSLPKERIILINPICLYSKLMPVWSRNKANPSPDRNDTSSYRLFLPHVNGNRKFYLVYTADIVDYLFFRTVLIKCPIASPLRRALNILSSTSARSSHISLTRSMREGGTTTTPSASPTRMSPGLTQRSSLNWTGILT